MMSISDGNGQDSTMKTILGLELFFGRDVLPKLEIEAKYLAERNFNYEQVAAFKWESTKGFKKDDYFVRIGSGKKCFIQAVEKFKSFDCHRNARLKISPADFTFEKGSSVYFGLRLFPCVTVGIADRIVHIEETSTMFECTFGTLLGHPAQGEEIFRVHIDENDTVFFTFEIVSRIISPLGKLGYPIARLIQKREAARYIEALESI